MRFKMPPEWASHQRMFIQWPVEDPVWNGKIDLARKAFAEVVKAIIEFEPVTVIVNPDQEQTAADLCGPDANILVLNHDDCWVRDNGCTFVIDEEDHTLVGVHWDFNAWGGKFPTFEFDRLVPSFLCSGYHVPEYRVPMILEGGSIHTNGKDTIITTAECLLNKNRNPSMTQSEISSILCSTLGVLRVIYLPFGLIGDETDGHVDNICCFIDENTVLIPHTDDMTDANYERLELARKTAEDAGLNVLSIIHPPHTEEDKVSLTLSYVNFVYVNGGIVMPGFGGELSDYDALAKAALCAIFPDRRIVQVMTRDILRGGGNIHCITQQMPSL